MFNKSTEKGNTKGLIGLNGIRKDTNLGFFFSWLLKPFLFPTLVTDSGPARWESFRADKHRHVTLTRARDGWKRLL